MVRHRGKGKIPRSEWAKIAGRRASGEGFASIALDYGCTAPAIRYIVGRTPDQSRAGSSKPKRGRPLRVAAVDTVAPRTDERGEPQLRRLTGLQHQGATGPRPVLSPELTTRISGDIAQLLVAIDAVVSDSSTEMVARLRSAAESIMRCAARLLVETERRGGTDAGQKLSLA